VITKKGGTKVVKNSLTIEDYYPELNLILKNVKWEVVKKFDIPIEEEYSFTFYFDYKHKRVLDSNETLY